MAGVYISDSANDGFFDGATIASVVAYPFQYRPLTGRLSLIKRMSFKFVLIDATVMPDRPLIRAPHIQSIYLESMLALVDSPENVSAWHIQPTSSVNTWGCTIMASGRVLETDALDPYIEWLWGKGYRTKAVNVQNQSVGDETLSFRPASGTGG